MYYSVVLVDLLNHGLDLNIFQQSLPPLLTQCLEIVQPFPEIVSELKLLFEGIEVLIVTFSVDVENILVSHHLIDLCFKLINFRLVVNDVSSLFCQPFFINYFCQQLLKLPVDLFLQLFILFLELVHGGGAKVVDLIDEISSLSR